MFSVSTCNQGLLGEFQEIGKFFPGWSWLERVEGECLVLTKKTSRTTKDERHRETTAALSNELHARVADLSAITADIGKW